MDDQVKAWTRAWHTVLDEELGPEENANIEARYTDPCGDFRLHFEFWTLSDEAQRMCFEMLPLGKQIANRVINNPAWETNMILPEVEAKRMLVKAIDDVERFIAFAGGEEDLPVRAHQPIRILRGTKEALEALEAEPLDELWGAVSDLWYDLDIPDEYSRAYTLMNEILYRSASDYMGVYHTVWPYVERTPEGLDPFANLLRMNRCEIEWLYDEEGPIVFYNDDETINDTVEVKLQLDGQGLQNVSDQINTCISEKVAYHLKRGFSPERFDDVEIGISGMKHARLKKRPKDNPNGADLVERGWTTLSKGELVNPEYGLFYQGQEDGPHTDGFKLMLHYIDGQRQRARRAELGKP